MKQAQQRANLFEVFSRLVHARVTKVVSRGSRLFGDDAAEAGDRVIAFAYKQDSPEARQAVLKELKEMLTRYLLP